MVAMVAAGSQGLPLVVHEAKLAMRMLDQPVQHSPGGSQFHDGNGLKRTSPRREALLLGVMAIKTKNELLLCAGRTYKASISSSDSPVMVAMVAAGMPAAFMPAAFLNRSPSWPCSTP